MVRQIRKVLDMIESQRDIDNIYKAGGWISALETKIESMYPKVALEVNSRLKLKHCDYFMKLSAGWIYREGGLTMSGAADALQSRGRELGREEIRFCLILTGQMVYLCLSRGIAYKRPTIIMKTY